MSRLRKYVQMRFLCRTCGEYDNKTPDRPRRVPVKCHWCGRDGLVKLAECRGKQPIFAAMGASRPVKKMADWIQGGNRRVGKSPGRPRKSNVEPDNGTNPQDPETEADDLGGSGELDEVCDLVSC